MQLLGLRKKVEYLVLAVEHLCKRYGNRWAVNNVSLRVEAGKSFGLYGSMGAGKTTTLRSILGLIQYDKGSILWNNRQLHKNPPKIGYLPEDRGMYPNQKVSEQLIYLGRLEGMSKTAAVHSVQYWMERLYMLEYYDKKMEQLPRNVQEKVKIVAALIHNPELIILDEPFTHLEPRDILHVGEILNALSRDGKVMMISSHQLTQLEPYCKEIGILDRGKIVTGNAQEID